MKIGVLGAHGVGKTGITHSVMSMLKRDGVDSHLIAERAYHCPKSLPIGKDSVVESQIWIITDQISEELWAEPLFDVVMCDRTVVDNYAYMMHHLERGAFLDSKKSAAYGTTANKLKDVVVTWSKTYDGLLYVPYVPGSGNRLNRMQRQCRDFSLEIDERVRSFMEANQIEYGRLPPISSGGEAAARKEVRRILRDTGYL
jgi:hypothetical protein